MYDDVRAYPGLPVTPIPESTRKQYLISGIRVAKWLSL
jgi:hypothetical protein